MVDGGLWSSGEDKILVKALLEARVEQDFQVNWGSLVPGRSDEVAKKRWRILMKFLPAEVRWKFPEAVKAAAMKFPSLRKLVGEEEGGEEEEEVRVKEDGGEKGVTNGGKRRRGEGEQQQEEEEGEAEEGEKVQGGGGKGRKKQKTGKAAHDGAVQQEKEAGKQKAGKGGAAGEEGHKKGGEQKMGQEQDAGRGRGGVTQAAAAAGGVGFGGRQKGVAGDGKKPQQNLVGEGKEKQSSGKWVRGAEAGNVFQRHKGWAPAAVAAALVGDGVSNGVGTAGAENQPKKRKTAGMV